MELKQINSLVELFFKKYEEIILSNSKNIDDTFLVSLKEKNKGNKLFSYSWGVVNNKITVLSEYLKSIISKGDRCILLSENRPEWLISDISIMNAGGVTVPLFTTYSENDYKYIINDCKPKVCIISNDNQFRKIKDFIKDETIIISIDLLNQNIVHFNEIFQKNFSDNIKESEKEKKSYNKDIKRNNLACIIYTSGTTGNPKGVMLSHGGILSNCEGAQEILNSLVKDEIPVFLTWLPLSHSYEHTVQYVQILFRAKVYYAESLEKLLPNMAIAQPTIMTAVPRFYQNLYSKIYLNFSKQQGLKKKLIDKTILLGTKNLNQEKLNFKEKLLNYLCEKLVRKKVRNQFGGNLKAFVSGGGALDKKIGEFLNSIGLPTLQGYGLTETSPVVSCNIPGKIKIETVGPPFKTNEVRIAADGEILVKGENLMLGYWNMKQETDEVIKNGWLHTGDIGEITQEGNLKITDRKKEIIVNLGGENISPTKIENLLCLNEKIKQSFVYGDKKTYLVALIVSEVDKNRKEIEIYLENLNKSLSLVERVKKFKLIKEEFTIENGMLTPTLKLKRKKILQKYKEDLEKLY
ncbi:AMP-dependent synthetase/ligase [Candidatus Pelagibacter communis]|uniref:AMP-dependent synthetase/ligase n=1 Tax=Pelagibacter ubique TaxID=198252 RepID=UPI00094D0032|nr:long-chain fatty acid--CoA ligase [Candidatus Pelagibacter ubique]|tara:strand:- start:149 stop:1882 length:1734 start_codon:yes stop_codon:yes gene_type:complete